MKRDLDVIRRILTEIESWPAGFQQGGRFRTVALEGVEPAVVADHLWLLKEAGYVDAHDLTTMDSPHRELAPKHITNAGHDFLAAVRNDTVWQKLKSKAQEEGGNLPLGIVKQLADKFLQKHLGLSD